jgi:hypothetical protein
MSDILEEMQRQIDELARQMDELRTQEYNMAQNHGWIGGAWQKDPLADGYSGKKNQIVSNTNAAAGDNVLTSDTVPAGEIWNLQSIRAYNANNAPSAIVLYMSDGSADYYLNFTLSIGANVSLIWTGKFTMAPGEVLKAYFGGCTAGDDIHLIYSAVRVDIDQ